MKPFYSGNLACSRSEACLDGEKKNLFLASLHHFHRRCSSVSGRRGAVTGKPGPRETLPSRHRWSRVRCTVQYCACLGHRSLHPRKRTVANGSTTTGRAGLCYRCIVARLRAVPRTKVGSSHCSTSYPTSPRARVRRPNQDFSSPSCRAPKQSPKTCRMSVASKRH